MPEFEEFSEGQVIEPEQEYVETSSLAQVHASEINQMVATAKRYPRNLAKFRKAAYHMITQDEATAAECSFAIPRDGRVVAGPSVRFAEIIFTAWGNCRSKSRTVDEGSEFVTSEGMFYDVENNAAISCEVKRRIVDKEGRRYSPDMIMNTANAAGSIAARTAILRGIPKAQWIWLWEESQKVVKGNVKTLTQRRDKAVELFRPFGMTPQMLCQVIGVEGVSEMTIDHLTTLQAILNALKDGDVTVETLMRNTQDKDVADKGKETLDRIKSKYQKDTAAAQAKLDEKRKQAKAKPTEPTKVADVKPPPPVKEEEVPF